MTRYIQGKDGKFAGSLPDSVKAPSAAPMVHGGALATDAAAATPDYAALAAKLNAAKVPDWAKAAWEMNPAQTDEMTDDHMLVIKSDYAVLPSAGSPIEHDCQQDEIHAMFRASKITDDTTDDDGQVVSYWALPSINDSDDKGRRAVIEYSHDPRKVVQRYNLGHLDTDGNFHRETKWETFCSDNIAWDSPVGEAAGSNSVEDLKYSVRMLEDGSPAGLECTAVTEWFETDYEYEPADDYWKDRAY